MPTTSFAYQNPVFQPAMRIISAVTNANPAQVTTTFDHNYHTGLIVRLVIPTGYGMVAPMTTTMPNGFLAPITVTGATTFTMPIDTTALLPFAVPAPNPGHFYTDAQVIPVGEVNSSIYLSTVNVL